MSLTLIMVLTGLIATGPQGQTPPIFHPGAPGEASRVISADEAVELSRAGFVEADVRFMQHMIVHHGQAVEMVALLENQGASPVVKQLGRRISLSQAAEIALMREWLVARGLPTTMQDAHAGHAGHLATMADPDVPVMPGMLSPAQMTALAATTGPEFDRLFLEGMIRHHQGALDMVDALLAHPDTAEDPMLSDFTSAVVADQSTEILRMQSVLSELQ